jgi:hypothetical protein
MLRDLLHPHSFRIAGVVFLIAMAQRQLPALFALPAGLGDISVGIAAPLVARKLAQGTARRGALAFNLLGMADLVVAMILGAVTGYQLLHVTPAAGALSELPIVLIPTAAVPLLFVLHITSMSALRRARRSTRPAAGPRRTGATRPAVVTESPAPGAR